jgi:fused signal recognition particle receptor
MFNKLRQALGKATELFSHTKGAPLDDIEGILLQADIGVKYTETIIQKLKKVKAEPVEQLKNEIFNLLNLPKPQMKTKPPMIIMVSGVNGSGKTTTVAKLAYLYNKKGNVILASGDTYRDAAHEQLEIWSKKANVEIVGSQKGQDSAAVVYDAISRARSKTINTVLIDTAGRLHTRTDLMEELKKINRVITKLKPEGPDLNILTIDATLGQNSIQQARIFTKEIGINGLILTKFDGTAKGGAIIPICNELNLPVLYLGVGESLEDLIEFDPKTFVDALFE